MPGETIEIDTAQYPALEESREGDAIELKVTGKVVRVGEGKVEIETESIEPMNMNESQTEMRRMSRQPSMTGGMREEE